MGPETPPPLVNRPPQPTIPGMGGLGRPEDADFNPSNVLMSQVIGHTPPAFADLANVKINRPADTSEAYGLPKGTFSAGGYINGDPLDISVSVGRGEEARGQGRGPGDWVAQNTARHELIHRLDGDSGEFLSWTPEFRQLVHGNLGGLGQVSGGYGPVQQVAIKGDWPHVFTTLSETFIDNPYQLPPAIRSYMSRVLNQPRKINPGRDQVGRESVPPIEPVEPHPSQFGLR